MKCSICGKESQNGVLVKSITRGRIVCCCDCLMSGSGKDTERVIDIVTNGKKSKANGELTDDCNWAAFWSPDCEDYKAKKRKKEIK